MAMLMVLSVSVNEIQATPTQFLCAPAAADEMGPFYEPDAPLRNRVGEGYLLMGTVKSAIDCSPIPGARIEIWMTGPQGRYGKDWRATLFSADNGSYYFVSHMPPRYGLGRPHIHIKVTAQGFATLVTQHYPLAGAGEGLLDLVLTRH